MLACVTVSFTVGVIIKEHYNVFALENKTIHLYVQNTWYNIECVSKSK